MADKQFINDNTYSWSSLSLSIDGTKYYGIKSVTFGDKIEVALGYSTGKHFRPVSRTQGQYSAEDTKVTMRLDSWKAVADKLGSALSSKEVTISAQWQEKDLSTFSVSMERCRVIGVNITQDQVADESQVEVTFSVMSIKWNGKQLYAQG